MNADTPGIRQSIENALPGLSLRVLRDSLILENAQDLPRVAKFLKESPEWAMDYLSSITACDYLDSLESVYHFFSISRKIGPLVLRIRTDRESPIIPSLTPLYKGAELQEREVYDMFGIRFEGHPDLRRLLLWEGFEGFPLRKDYEPEDSDTLGPEDLDWLKKHGSA